MIDQKKKYLVFYSAKVQTSPVRPWQIKLVHEFVRYSSETALILSHIEFGNLIIRSLEIDVNTSDDLFYEFF